MNMQPMHVVAVPKPMSPSGNQPDQDGGGQVQLQPGGRHIQSQVTSLPTPNNATSFAISVQKGHALLGLSIAQVVLGVLGIFFNAVAYYFHTSYTVIAPGIWAGILVSGTQLHLTVPIVW